jgi:outer membrane protein assembly factor BamB
MIRSLSFLFIFTTIFQSDKQAEDRFPLIEKTFPKNWEIFMGEASYRTNIEFEDNLIIIGSNGNGFNDAYIFDENAGVYLINRRNGKLIRKIGSKVFGDMDVNGVLVFDDKIYFGNDNEEFICSAFDGKTIWRIPVSGDVEHQPTLLNINGKKAIVYGTEIGELTAVDPENGKKIWTYYSPNFSGWKPTDNRMIFKVKSYFSYGRIFFTKPTLLDVNKDGVDDLIYSDYAITAISGKNGKQIWRINSDNNGYCVSSLIPQRESSETILSYVHFNSIDNANDIYSLASINTKGKLVSKKYLQQTNDYPDDVLNILRTQNKESVFAIGDSVYTLDQKRNINGFDFSIKYKTKKYFSEDSTMESRNYYEPLIANKEFSYKNHDRCILILHQVDMKKGDFGYISIFSLDKGQILDSWELPGRSEFPPLIEDINRDGKQDLLINCSNGRLYCYTLTNLKFK